MRPEGPWQRRLGVIYMYTIFHPHPIPGRCHLQQSIGYHTVLVGLPYSALYPSNRIGKRKSKTKNTGTVQSRAALVRPPHYMLPGPPPRAITQFHLPLATHPRPLWGQRGHPTDLCVPQGSFRLDKVQSLRVRRGVGSSGSPLHCSLSGGLFESCHP